MAFVVEIPPFPTTETLRDLIPDAESLIESYHDKSVRVFIGNEAESGTLNNADKNHKNQGKYFCQSTFLDVVLYRSRGKDKCRIRAIGSGNNFLVIYDGPWPISEDTLFESLSQLARTRLLAD